MYISIQQVKNAFRSSAKLSLFLLFFIPASVFGQEINTKLTQTIRGVITDAASGEAVPFASVALADSQGRGTVSDRKSVV